MSREASHRDAGDTERAEAEAEADRALRSRMAAAGVSLAGPRPGVIKASDALVELMRPLIDALAREAPFTQSSMEQLLGLGIAVWNAGSRGYRTAESFLADCPHGLKPEEVGPRDLLECLFARRQTLFPNDRRLIGDLVVQEASPGNFGVAVTWSDGEGGVSEETLRSLERALAALANPRARRGTSRKRRRTRRS